MTTWIALLRGINVGGRNILPMKELREVLVSLGCENPRTYIQSGNCVFDHPDTDPDQLSEQIGGGINAGFEFRPRILMLTVGQLEAAIKANPYLQAADDPRSLHFYFLSNPPSSPDLAGMQMVAKESESFSLVGQVLYLFAPEGIGRSKLAEVAEKKLGVAATARNFRTVIKILEMAQN